jgi:hypothetical protein
MHIDNTKLRKSIPKGKAMNPAFLLKLIKNYVGADLSKIVAPVHLNEPISIL